MLVLFCVLQEQLGKPVKLTMGEYTNLKLTTPEDMIVATTILESRELNFVLEPAACLHTPCSRRSGRT